VPKQYHYVVCFDEESNTWAIDFDVSLNCDEGSVWNTEKQAWSYAKNEAEEDLIIQDLSTKLRSI
jgi:hypothetical protein